MYTKIAIVYVILFSLIGVFFGIKNYNTSKNINIEDSIVIIVPEQKLISKNDNPGGILDINYESGIGAGFFISNDGKIATSYHLVARKDVKYRVITNDKKEYIAEVISRTPESDRAILKIDSNSIALSPLLTREGVRGWVGKNITSYGVNPETLTIIKTEGKILKTNKKLDNISSLIKFSGIIADGFSGGPIINSKGQVIGVNYAIIDGENYGISY